MLDCHANCHSVSPGLYVSVLRCSDPILLDILSHFKALFVVLYCLLQCFVSRGTRILPPDTL
jgi:hypothetical protein